jgi:hypothetical protein
MFLLVALSLAAPCTDSNTDACWEGDWVKDASHHVTVQNASDNLLAELRLDGDEVASGIIDGTGPKRHAPLEGCGGEFHFQADGTLTVTLDGPECAVSFAGTYKRPGAPASSVGPNKTPTLCGAASTVLSCATTKQKVVSVCHDSGDLVYHFGTPGKVELSLKGGTRGERDLASGSETSWTFTNDGYSYQVFEVTSRPEDTGAGVLITKAEKTIATVACGPTWYRAP